MFMLTVGLVFGFVYPQSSESPNLAFPRENEIIYSGDLFIFAEPHPEQIYAQCVVRYEISHRDTGKSVHKGNLTPESGYETYLPVVKWKNGNYFLKVFYVNPETKAQSPAAWRSFTVQNN